MAPIMYLNAEARGGRQSRAS